MDFEVGYPQTAGVNIRSKEALGREKDLLTAKELRAIAAKRKQRE